MTVAVVKLNKLHKYLHQHFGHANAKVRAQQTEQRTMPTGSSDAAVAASCCTPLQVCNVAAV